MYGSVSCEISGNPAKTGYVMTNARRTSIYLANWFVGFAAIYKKIYIDNAIGVMAF